MDEASSGSTESRRPRQDTEIIQDNTEDVPFSPQADTGFGIKEVAIGDKTIEIHETHNLKTVIAAYVQPSVKNRKTQEELQRLSSTYGPMLRNDGFVGVLERLKQEYPRLYAKLVSIVFEFYAKADAKNQTTEQSGVGLSQPEPVDLWVETDDENVLNDYFFSKAFGAMAIIGPEIDLEVPLSKLCED